MVDIDGEVFALFPAPAHKVGPIETAALESIRQGHADGVLTAATGTLEAVIVATAADIDVRVARTQSVAYTSSVMLMLLQAAGLTPDLEAPAEDEGNDDRDLAAVLRHGAAARADGSAAG